MQSEILLSSSDGQTTRVPLSDADLSVGRDPECSVVIDDPGVSRHHVTIGFRLLVRDENSANGLWYQGRRVREATIGLGDQVSLGKKNFLRLEIGSPAAPRDVSNENVEALSDALSRLAERECELAECRDRLAALEAQLRAQPMRTTPAVSEIDEAAAVVNKASTEKAGIKKTDAEKADVAPTRPELPVGVVASQSADLERELRKILGEASGLADRSPAVPGQAPIVRIMAIVHSFARHIEKVVTRLAQSYRGAISPDGTYLPDDRESRSLKHRVDHALRDNDASGPGVEDLETYLMDLRVWVAASLRAYQTAAQKTNKELLGRVTPNAIRRDLGLGVNQKLKPKDALRLWERLEERVAEIDLESLDDRLEESAAEEAVHFFENYGNVS